MQARHIRKSTKGLPGLEEGQEIEIEFFTLGRVYEVIAIYHYQSYSYLLLIDDLGRLVPRYSYCFELTQRHIPEEWQVNVIDEAQITIIGPEFLIDYEDFAALLDYDPRMTEKFRQYVEEYFD